MGAGRIWETYHSLSFHPLGKLRSKKVSDHCFPAHRHQTRELISLHENGEHDASRQESPALEMIVEAERPAMNARERPVVAEGHLQAPHLGIALNFVTVPAVFLFCYLLIAHDQPSIYKPCV